ncbi:MAG: S8 family peptidase [Candidatus Zixiibacteriota bacterium]|nr:MAG: S8 family peptidase [candidate division Zixibacteria bacterium]
MRLLRILILLLIFSLVSPALLAAGELSPGLQQMVSRAGVGEKVKVWIRLPRTDQSRRLKTATVAVSRSRAERHSNALRQLKSSHAAVQRGVLNRLQVLEKAGKVENVQSFWIANLIEAEVEARELPALAALPDIEIIYEPPEITLIAPVETNASPSPSGTAAAESNLVYIGADQAWAAGYTGAGRLVCSFDTGVQGSHSALKDSWKGLDGDSTAAWFDPVFQLAFPHTQVNSLHHGSLTMGLMLGHDDVSGDTIGVALDAKWISAAVIDINWRGGSVILRAFEWAADPDGNPNTVDDVPDVINHSWGYNRINYNDWDIWCEEIFFEAIDHTEALGIVNIFSAGNSGPDALSIANPANRALDSLDCFAVGALDHNGDSIWFQSSRGPSDCNGAIKPNTVAPGHQTRTSNGLGGYTSAWSGSSMAAPHVSGLVALLRQKNPNATVDEIKQAILTSTATHANFGTVPNFTYGWGRIDCMAALNALPDVNSSRNVRIFDFNYPGSNPGDTIRGTVVAQCLGANVTNVSGTITGSHPSLTVLQPTAFFGDMTTGDTIRSLDTIVAVVSDTVTPGQILSIDFLISGTSLSVPSQLHFLVGPILSESVATHNTGRIKFSVSNFGMYGLEPESFVSGSGVGFTLDDGPNDLYEGGLMIGRSLSEVSSAVHTYRMEADNDFRVAPGGNLVFTSPGEASYEQTYSAFDDGNAVYPLGLRIEQETFADTGINNDIVFMRYILHNESGANIYGAYVGLFFDWEPGGSGFWSQSIGGYELDDQFAWIAYYNGGVPKDYRGMKLIAGQLATAMTERESILSHIAVDGGDGFETWEKYQALTDGLGTADTYRDWPNDLCQVMAAGPITLLTSGVDTVAFAILAGDSFSDIQGAAQRALSVPTDVESDETGSLPERFTLYQNFPNPFNPTTTISFELPRRSDYQLTIFNVLGRTVHTECGNAPAGKVRIVWNAEEQASGVYFYRVEAGEQSSTRKMLLLK